MSMWSIGKAWKYWNSSRVRERTLTTISSIVFHTWPKNWQGKNLTNWCFLEPFFSPTQRDIKTVPWQTMWYQVWKFDWWDLFFLFDSFSWSGNFVFFRFFFFFCLIFHNTFSNIQQGTKYYSILCIIQLYSLELTWYTPRLDSYVPIKSFSKWNKEKMVSYSFHVEVSLTSANRKWSM